MSEMESKPIHDKIIINLLAYYIKLVQKERHLSMSWREVGWGALFIYLFIYYVNRSKVHEK